MLYEQSKIYLLPSHKQQFYEKARIISATIWQEIVVVLHFGLQKIEQFLNHKEQNPLLFCGH